ncbi:MAG: hypothetical protein ABWX90_00745 [Candidatus Saccharimonadales bacterium]
MRTPKGYVKLANMAHFAGFRYPDDVTLAAWTYRTLLQDMTFFERHRVQGGVVGRPYRLEVRHAATLQTREEWLESPQDTELLRSPALWLVGIESLKAQLHRLYVHQVYDGVVDNNCRDGRGHARYVSAHGYSTDMCHMSADDLDRRAHEQGLNPCIYSFLREWVLTQLG